MLHLAASRTRIATTLERIRRGRTRRRWIDSLSALDDRTLQDIGLQRANIRSAVFEAERRCAATERRAQLAPVAEPRNRHEHDANRPAAAE